jgi:hypothetical protein
MADNIVIENPDVIRDIQRLAERTGKPASEAVADAVRAQLGGATEEPLDAELAALLAEIDALPKLGAPLTDEDLYDEDGMPR